jgi:hypothetical protein
MTREERRYDDWKLDSRYNEWLDDNKENFPEEYEDEEYERPENKITRRERFAFWSSVAVAYIINSLVCYKFWSYFLGK